ncbi:BSD-domain protein, putative [Plasmodium gallinaceum]|uniref:BSD-domain protein, putative n=1 Tax=Plasmodium gallinaceum TaxID=5849 RepID=A0A1J1GQ19_PLAGA|nr:BSD-domain protein, putative [Plasmodium gallinaceum]CRG94536.1 BSD-domain protein, putative [Plasmodium gallinaceum]
MGNKNTKKYELCEIQYEKEFELKYPWNEIIKWGSNDLNVDVSLTIIKKIIEEIKDITLDEESYFNITEGKSLDEFKFENSFVEWATALLKEITNLKKIRYNIVPKLVNENEFWLRYFATIKIIIIKNIFDTIEN